MNDGLGSFTLHGLGPGMLQHVSNAVSALAANRLRAALAMLGIVIGVLSSLLLIGIGEGTQMQVNQAITELGPNVIDVLPGRRDASDLSFSAPVSISPLTMDDVRALRQNARMLKATSPIVLSAGTVQTRSRHRNTSIIGASAEFIEIRSMHVAQGRFLSEGDCSVRRRVVVLGRKVLQELYGDRTNPLGQSVRIGSRPFRVIGVMEPRGRSLGIDLDDLVFVPATTALEIYKLPGLSQILTAARTKEDASRAIEEIGRVLRYRRHGEQSFTIRSQEDLLATFRKLTTTIKQMMMAISLVALVIGGIGVMNIMFMSVRERYREIGVRRAVGATRHDILWQFLIESATIAMAGGLGALAMAGVIAAVLQRLSPTIPLHIDSEAVALSLTSALVTGILSGLAPARSASLVDPVEALRAE